MLLLFIMFLFFILHIQFLFRNIVFGTYETTYFQFRSVYLFDNEIALTSLLFSLGSAAAFTIGYLSIYRRSLPSPHLATTPYLAENLKTARVIAVSFGVVQIIANLMLAVTSDFVYQVMAETLESSGFIYELRIFMLVALGYIALNVRPAVFWRAKDYKWLRIVLLVYSVSILIIQARSRIFEFAAVLIFAYLVWSGDRVRWRYLAMLAGAMLLPNLIVLGRLGIPDDPRVLIDGIFSFEYSITLNNFLGAAIEHNYAVHGGVTFLKSLWLLIPSPIRNLMNIQVVKNDAYDALAWIAQVRNGGYSMLAEMYQNFGWFGLAAFGLMGFSIGALNRRAVQVGSGSTLAAIAPVVYAAFVVAFRNDFGIFLKFIVQSLIVAGLFRIIMRYPEKSDVERASTSMLVTQEPTYP